MFRKNQFVLAAALMVSALLAGCQSGEERGSTPDAAPSVAAPANPLPGVDAGTKRSPGKPTAPISIEYDVVGKAVVGQPLGVNLRVSSKRPDQPVTMHYRINDSSAMVFPESQAQRIELGSAADESPRAQQVTVIPQREGRLFLNVSAEVQTENGTMFRSLAIPIQVGARSAAPAVNGEIRKTPEGESVVSMPASESGGT